MLSGYDLETHSTDRFPIHVYGNSGGARFKRAKTPYIAPGAWPSLIGSRPEAQHSIPASRAAQNDPRWPCIVAALVALREQHRHAVRIVDADCACGTLLIAVAHRAHAVGFTAVEARGIDDSPALIGRARAAAARLRDPAIGLTFDRVDMVLGLAEEADAPADIVLWHGIHDHDHRSDMRTALAAAGRIVIGDPATPVIERRAA